ncbi:MAG: hypothetical protein NTV81_04130 [Candidatus Komeilibacteria bacterium]|nr:hypothetical protein [Candidatus Komeilibacteria bacterium]
MIKKFIKSKLIKRDKYRSSRGGDARRLDMFCVQCQAFVLTYQKDGHGSLLRLYFDRILAPTALLNLEKQTDLTGKPLTCLQCGAILAMPYIYEKEQRPAFRIIQATIIKRLKK